MKYPKMTKDLVLIRVPKEAQQDTKIALPDEVQENMAIEKLLNASSGFAVSVGSECQTVELGDECLYRSSVGNIITHDNLDQDSDYIVVSEKDIFCTYPSEKLNA